MRAIPGNPARCSKHRVDLKIEILSDESQQPLTPIIWGAYECSGETYSLGAGLSGEPASGYNREILGSKKECAVFVAGGIRYTLSGYVDINTMKVIVDSMKYWYQAGWPALSLAPHFRGGRELSSVNVLILLEVLPGLW